MSERFKKITERLSPELKQRIAKSFAISEQILDILERKEISQRQLADMLGKNESEISKWMKGDHNFTIDTIAKLEVVLGEKIIDTPNNFKQSQVKLLETKKVIQFNIYIENDVVINRPIHFITRHSFKPNYKPSGYNLFDKSDTFKQASSNVTMELQLSSDYYN